MQFDWKRLSNLDRAIAIGGAVSFIALFLPWWGASSGPFSVSISGWSAGFTAWAGGLLLTAAAVLLVLRRAGAAMPSLRVGPAVLVAGIAALGLLLVIIRWVSLPRYHGFGVGARYGLYVALLAGIVEVAAAVVEMRASGEAMPWVQAQHADHPAEPGSGTPPATEE
jgi:hypothetical protein